MLKKKVVHRYIEILSKTLLNFYPYNYSEH